jgi:hypothetical protein
MMERGSSDFAYLSRKLVVDGLFIKCNFLCPKIISNFINNKIVLDGLFY